MRLPSSFHSVYSLVMKIQDLYQKISDFEKKLSPVSLEKSSCRQGCSKCCYTDISVFQIEANNIRHWFDTLSPQEKIKLNKAWSLPLSERENFQGEKVSSCSFLVNEACTIYEARPLICRTQGLALMFKEDDQVFLDICPLNEEMLEHLSKSEYLSLDLVNTILVQLEKLDASHTDRERMKLSALKEELWTQLQKI